MNINPRDLMQLRVQLNTMKKLLSDLECSFSTGTNEVDREQMSLSASAANIAFQGILFQVEKIENC